MEKILTVKRIISILVYVLVFQLILYTDCSGNDNQGPFVVK